MLRNSPEERSSQIRTSFEIQRPVIVLKLAPLRRFLHTLAVSSIRSLSVLRVSFSVIIGFMSIWSLVSGRPEATSPCVYELITQHRPVVTGQQ
jgi:hypothetical protein